MDKVEKILRHSVSILFNGFKKELSGAVGTQKKLLDVGCGVDSPVQFLENIEYKMGVDIYAPSIEISKSKKIHNDYSQINVLEIEKHFGRKSYNCVFASEIIEHLDKNDGIELLEQMASVAIEKVVITTPVGFLPQPSTETNPWQLHKSGWDVEEMEDKGYEVIGFNGARYIWNIKFLWVKLDDASFLIKVIRKVLILLSQLYVRKHPKYAHQMICVKNIINKN